MSATAQQLLDETNDAILRILQGAEFVTVNGQQFHFSRLSELRALRKELTVEIAAAAGEDGRGSWEAVFSD
ncbi:MAG: hypothetical protein GXP31_13165 [Kiritimatiellaeota bacterium]|nr:hypothetical protein [Kiritimatiellota bacterium]